MVAQKVAALVVAIGILLICGCEPANLGGTTGVVVNAPPGPPAPPAPPPGNSPTADAVAGEPAAPGASVPSAEFQTAAAAAIQQPPQQSPLSVPESGAAGKPFINLSAGVALPQLLPEGTQIGVSVDYSLRGQLQTSCRYVLVVESSAGEIGIDVKLDPAGGTYQGFLPLSVRPEHQPFRARIDEVPATGPRVRVSNSAVLATSY